MDYRYKDTIAVPREYAITRNWLYRVKDQNIFVLGQEFLMCTLYWIACHVDMKILRPCMNNVHTGRVKCRTLSDMWRSTLKIGAVQFAATQNPLAPTLPFLCVSRNAIRYGFRAGAKAHCGPPCQQRFFACSILAYSRKGWFPVSRCRLIFRCVRA